MTGQRYSAASPRASTPPNVRDALDSLLPEPLADVLEREEAEREESRTKLSQS